MRRKGEKERKRYYPRCVISFFFSSLSYFPFVKDQSSSLPFIVRPPGVIVVLVVVVIVVVVSRILYYSFSSFYCLFVSPASYVCPFVTVSPTSVLKMRPRKSLRCSVRMSGRPSVLLPLTPAAPPPSLPLPPSRCSCRCSFAPSSSLSPFPPESPCGVVDALRSPLLRVYLLSSLPFFSSLRDTETQRDRVYYYRALLLLFSFCFMNFVSPLNCKRHDFL